jgi:hypothetical protein
MPWDFARRRLIDVASGRVLICGEGGCRELDGLPFVK